MQAVVQRLTKLKMISALSFVDICREFEPQRELCPAQSIDLAPADQKQSRRIMR